MASTLTPAALRLAKTALRKQMKARIAQLSDAEKRRQSDLVVGRLIASDHYRASARISVFLSMHDEIQTIGLLRRMFADRKCCYIPHYIGDRMDMVRLDSMDDYDRLPETSWKIKQPKDDERRENALETGGLDLILVPGLAFTASGCRLGRGKGYYDKFLARCVAAQAKRPAMIALAFREQICDEGAVPMTDQDFILDAVLFCDDQSATNTGVTTSA